MSRSFAVVVSVAQLLLLSGALACGPDDPGAAGEGSDAPAAGSEGSVVTGEVPSADGVPIAYEARGAGEPALVLVHGWTNDRRIWGAHPRTLSESHRVVTLELAGHGESGADREEWTMDAFGEDVVAVVDELGLDRVVLVGFSMGSAVVLEAAERMPERVLGVVFVDAMQDPEQAPPPGQAEQMEAAFRANWGDTAFLRQFAFAEDAPASLVRQVAEGMPAQPREHWFTILRSTMGWSRTELHSTLEQLDVPLAAINTTRVPTNVEAWRDYDPSFTLDTLRGVGHAGILLWRTDDFDARLLDVVERFEESAGSSGG